MSPPQRPGAVDADRSTSSPGSTHLDRPPVGGHPGARSTPALGRPLRAHHLPPSGRRRAAAVHLRHDRGSRRDVAGTGESLGDRDRADGTSWSGLRFWATDRRSLIDAGAGYWRYIPGDDGIRFLTRYDYRPTLGRTRRPRRPIDVPTGLRLEYRGASTASPVARGRHTSRAVEDQAIAHAAAVAGLAGVFAYQGLVRKLWKARPR